MKLSKLILAAAVVGAASYVAAPSDTQAFSTLGFAINADRCGFQVNPTSFTDPNANNNTTADANFPGADGAEMALWKAAAEWAADLRGNNGNGDPHQPGGLGSGGSNFDFMYHGVTTATPGSGSDSAVIWCSSSTLGSGVYAATWPGPFGWVMIFDNSATNNFNWQDGPGNETSDFFGRVDIEGIGVHELGHSLGLGHSGDGSATMTPAVSPSQSYSLARSINTDDTNGVKAIYGTKSATKPKITSITGTIQQGNVITINGQNFSATGNEVWFTKKTNGSTLSTPMTPTKVTALASSGGGTVINVTVPANTASGDIIVHRSGATSDHSLKSTPFPYNLNAGPSTPTITSLSATTLPIMAIPTPSLTINGANLSGSSSVRIGTKIYGAGQFNVVNDAQVVVDFNPPPDNVGLQSVQITTISGLTNQVFLTVALPTQHVLLVDNPAPNPGDTITIWCGAPSPNLNPLLSHSGCFGVVDLSPYLISSIGACGDWAFFDPIVPATNSSGVSTTVVPLPPAYTGVRFLQSWTINLLSPTFPLPATNLISLSVF